MKTLRYRFLSLGQKIIERGAWFLTPISFCWGLFSHFRNRLYDSNWIPIRKVNKTVVSVGNIVAGGTGKTPFVHLLAQQFPKRKIAILSRGYGGVADEALLLKRKLPEAHIYVGKNRFLLAQQAVREGADLILLDDGFQHRALYRDFDLVLLHASDPFGKGHFLPRGYLRESPQSLARADAVLTHGTQPVVPGAICIKAFSVPGQREKLQGLVAGIFCGIAKPAEFKKMLAELGVVISAEWILFDHEPVSLERLKKYAADCRSLGATALICTEKDRVKLPGKINLQIPLFALEIEMRVVEGHLEWEKLVEKIDQKIDNGST
jgi:tetraacyldisaccharide 4'-kinase